VTVFAVARSTGVNPHDQPAEKVSVSPTVGTVMLALALVFVQIILPLKLGTATPDEPAALKSPKSGDLARPVADMLTSLSAATSRETAEVSE
jgi:hypothetical protein